MSTLIDFKGEYCDGVVFHLGGYKVLSMYETQFLCPKIDPKLEPLYHFHGGFIKSIKVKLLDVIANAPAIEENDERAEHMALIKIANIPPFVKSILVLSDEPFWTPASIHLEDLPKDKLTTMMVHVPIKKKPKQIWRRLLNRCCLNIIQFKRMMTAQITDKAVIPINKYGI